MDKRTLQFFLVATAIIFGGMWINSLLIPRRPQPPQVAKNDVAKAGGEKQPGGGEKKPDEKVAPEKKPDENEPPEKKPEETKPDEKVEPKVEAAPEPEIPEQWLTLGSMDANDPYRILVTLTNRGAAVARIELNSRHYRDAEDRSGYLGHIADPRKRGDGCRVRLVGPGTPADGKLRGERWTKDGDRWRHEPGDLITKIDGQSIRDADDLEKELAARRYGQEITLTVKRGDREIEILIALGRRPLKMVHPEDKDPLSLLLTLQQFDEEELKVDPDSVANVGEELKGLDLWRGNWTVDEADRDQEHVTFRRAVPGKNIEIRKTFRLAKVPDEFQDDRVYKAYHLDVQIEVKNTGTSTHKIAYQLDGPTGLPLEGTWYGSKISPASGTAGFRDVLFSLGGSLQAIHTTEIANGKAPPPYKEFGDKPVVYAGVDTQYFAALLVPGKNAVNSIAMAHALRVGLKNDDARLTNVSCRLVSEAKELKAGESLQHDYTFFAGPKKPELVDQYGVGDIVYYGWPIYAFFAKPLVLILHFFYKVVPNYGIAIILLTVLVRGCMFPMSRKQALNAQKMQELQPEIKKIQEKYKKDLEARSKAQQELFRKHNYNPLGGCLLLFVQLPIFIGLYRALMIDVDLRGAALITENIQWCSNLAAPDMFYDWSRFMPAWVNLGQGIFGLGPYLNLLPIATVFLFNWQQKKMMPPPTDEQQAMQQKIMQYMMIFMGLLFYKVACGLCIYFIASSLWGLAERQFLPKRHQPGADAPQTRADAKADARAAAERDARLKKKDK